MPDTVHLRKPLDAVVLGAGISGLLAAKTLSEAGQSVAVFDKARGLGGRMATHRSGNSVFDHGAQYFTARDPVFRGMVERWVERGLVHLWSDGFAIASGALNQNGEPRYIGSRGMSTIPEHLAEGLTVSLGAKATACRWLGSHWEVSFQESEPGRVPVRARGLVLTAPVPQSLGLLKAGDVVLDTATLSALGRIDYSRCLAALIQLEGPSRVPAPGGLWLDGDPVSWVADNAQKGVSVRTGGAAVTVHAGHKFSLEHWDANPVDTAHKLAEAVRKWLGGEVRSAELHRWRYAGPLVVHPERCLSIRGPGPVVFAGDAFAGPRVEGAALSGMAAGVALLRQI